MKTTLKLQKYEQQTTKCAVLKVVDEIVVNFQVTHVCSNVYRFVIKKLRVLYRKE